MNSGSSCCVRDLSDRVSSTAFCFRSFAAIPDRLDPAGRNRIKRNPVVNSNARRWCELHSKKPESVGFTLAQMIRDALIKKTQPGGCVSLLTCCFSYPFFASSTCKLFSTENTPGTPLARMKASFLSVSVRTTPSSSTWPFFTMMRIGATG
jgi:hypothetical protein